MKKIHRVGSVNWLLDWRVAIAMLGVVVTTGAGHSATITVTGAGDGAIVDGVCTLREAIITANTNAAHADCGTGDPAPIQDEIAFQIPGAGVHTLQPMTALPAIVESVFVNGYSQPGALPNTLSVGSDAVLAIELDGSMAGAPVTGLAVSASSTEIRGLVVNRFGSRGISSSPTSSDFVVAGCFVGIDAAGTVDLGNGAIGIYVQGPDSLIGGSGPEDRNVVSGNGSSNIHLAGAAGSFVLGNYVGTDAAGTTAIPSSVGVGLTTTFDVTIGSPTAPNVLSGHTAASFGAGLQLNRATDTIVLGNLVGTDAAGTAPLPNSVGVAINPLASGPTIGTQLGLPGSGNVIANSIRDGIRVAAGPPFSVSNTISGNSIHGNEELGIDLGDDGVDVNDPLDIDGGYNNLQNYPVLGGVYDDGASLEVQWSLESTPSSSFEIEFFRNTTCDPSGAGEGETYIGTVNAATDASGSVAMSSSFATVNGTGLVTATATDLATHDTSEFSLCVAVQGGPPPTPQVQASKESTFDPLTQDHDLDGVLSPGDELTYTVEISNVGMGRALAVVFDDSPDPNTALNVGSVMTSLGAVTTGNTGGDSMVLVQVGDLSPGGTANSSVTISFDVTVDDPVPAGTTQVANQGQVSGQNIGALVTDDPSTPQLDDPTVDPIVGGPSILEIPTLGSWGAILLALLMVGLAWLRLAGENRRRQER